MKRCAVFSCMGLGDGLISLILSNNLTRAGAHVLTFHPFLSQMQAWFPHLSIQPFPKEEDLARVVSQCDHIFIFYEKSPAMKAVIDFCDAAMKGKVTILNPIATKKKNYPYWENGRFDGTEPFALNLQRFCKETLGIKDATKDNGISPPSQYEKNKYPKRVVIHPTSSRTGKNWGVNSFESLATALEKRGFTPVYILTKEEKIQFPLLIKRAADLSTLSEMAAFIYESGFMIGNDSGIGHLASCLGLPTITICRSKMASDFWQPGWTKGLCVLPPSWIPNCKGMRLRDKYWKAFISKGSVIRAFLSIAKTR